MIFFTVLVVWFSLAACAGLRQADAPSARETPSNDIALVRRLLQHQDAAVRILELCRSRTTRPELKQACTTGFDAVRERHLQLQGWERSWEGPASDSSISHDDQYKSFLDSMRDSKGDKFDEAAARAIRVHAREGISESTVCQERARHPDLKQFCSELNAAQERTVQNARQWLCDWFKDCVETRSR